MLNQSSLKHAARLACLLCAAVPVPAQNITGTIVGTVEDQSGAPVMKAEVAASNTGTGIAYRAVTNETGNYVLPLLPLGEYRVAIEVSGFKKFVRSGLALGGDQRLRVDARLELGSLAEQVTVTGATPLVKTDQATLGDNFDASDFIDLPINRSVSNLMQLAPGVSANVQGLSTGNVNGSRDSSTDYKVDGAPATSANLGLVSITPILESVEEFVVQTGLYSAEFGRGATQVNATTRAGGNQWRGILFHEFGNNVLNANSFMNNFYGVTSPVLRSNTFGGTFSGPVRLPKLYDGRNRTFFTFAYEGSRTRRFQQTISSVPTAAMRAGDFAGQPAIYDPATTRTNPSGSGFVRDLFPGNRVPAARMDPVTQRMLANSYPAANLAGIANNYIHMGAPAATANKYQVRGDHNFGSRSRVTGRYYHQPASSRNVLRFPGPAGAGGNSALYEDFLPQLASAEHIFVIRANLVNSIRYGFYRMHNVRSGPGTGEDWAAKLGLKNLAPDVFPVVSITNLSPFGGSALSDRVVANNHQIGDSLIWTTGRHSIKVGGEFRTVRSWSWIPRNTSGNFTFNTAPTQNALNQRDGAGFASFLLGLPSGSNVSLTQRAPFDFRFRYFAGYLQDDFRAGARLTINLGLRWEMTTPRKESRNRQSNFNLATMQLDLAGQDGNRETLTDYAWKDFQPRVGFAYMPFGNRRTVLRGGYGIFFTAPNSAGTGEGLNQGPWQRTYQYITQDNITYPNTLQTAGPPPMSFNDPYILSPLTAVTWIPRGYPDEYMQQWSFNVQREVAGGALLEVSYTGSKGTRLRMNYELNQVPANRLGPGNAQLRRPYPERGAIQAYFSPVGDSHYHALQTRFRRRLQGGLAVMAAYTFSKSIDNASGLDTSRSFSVYSVQDNHNLRAEKSASSFNRPHNLGYSLLWEIPAGKNRRLLNRGGISNALLGGWNVSLMSAVLAGRPLVLQTSTNTTGSLGGGSRPNRLRNGKLAGDERGRLRWFDAGAFALPDPYTFGSTSRTEPGHLGPGSVTLDLLLSKEFRFGENRRLQFRSEARNALNHFNPGYPNTTIGNPAVATIIDGNGGRSAVLALRLYF